MMSSECRHIFRQQFARIALHRRNHYFIFLQMFMLSSSGQARPRHAMRCNKMSNFIREYGKWILISHVCCAASKWPGFDTQRATSRRLKIDFFRLIRSASRIVFVWKFGNIRWRWAVIGFEKYAVSHWEVVKEVYVYEMVVTKKKVRTRRNEWIIWIERTNDERGGASEECVCSIPIKVDDTFIAWTSSTQRHASAIWTAHRIRN